jgi:cytochrome b involved in lipid metabolism
MKLKQKLITTAVVVISFTVGVFIPVASRAEANITLELKQEPKVTQVTVPVQPVVQLPKSTEVKTETKKIASTTSTVKKVSRLDQLVAKLKYGSKGKEVQELQTELKKAGFLPKNLKVTNLYGKTTQTAVKKYLASKNKKTTVAVKPETKPTTTPKTTTTTTPVVTKPSGYTLAQVQAANSATKCWTIVNGYVYDVTTYVNQHPGGSAAILSLCGKDGTLAYTGKHAGQPKPEATLKSFMLGLLQQ